jgi:acetolactate synthase-1/2/3 large subunit
MTNATSAPPLVKESSSTEPDFVPRSGGRVIADALRIHGVDRIFCVPGESYLDILDALHDMREIEVVTTKHEGAAANMAEADGKLTGRPGVCIVTRGPGATHASVGVHTAFHDSTPMILLIGQVTRGVRDRGAFQEIDFEGMFAPIAKWAAEIRNAARIPEYMMRAFHSATSDRPGPVVLALPEDVLAETVTVPDTVPFREPPNEPAPYELQALRSELLRAQQPLIILGGSRWSDEGCAGLDAFAMANQIPVAASFRRQDLIDNRHPCYIGHLTLGTAPYLARMVREADLVIAIGSLLGDVSTQAYTLLKAHKTGQRLIHIHASAGELGKVYQPDLVINASPASVAAALGKIEPINNPVWQRWTEDGRKGFVTFATPSAAPGSQHGVDLALVTNYLSNTLPADAIVSNGAGNYTVWVHRFFAYKKRGTEMAPTSGAMGYGLPAAIAAKLRHPGRTVVCFAGDGCMLMYPQELVTARECGAAIIVLVVNNGMYGTIRMHQERRFPGRPYCTDLTAPDFVAMARAFGAYAERVVSTDAFPAAFERCTEARQPSVLELCVDRNQITPDRRLNKA